MLINFSALQQKLLIFKNQEAVFSSALPAGSRQKMREESGDTIDYFLDITTKVLANELTEEVAVTYLKEFLWVRDFITAGSNVDVTYHPFSPASQACLLIAETIATEDVAICDLLMPPVTAAVGPIMGNLRDDTEEEEFNDDGLQRHFPIHNFFVCENKIYSIPDLYRYTEEDPARLFSKTPLFILPEEALNYLRTVGGEISIEYYEKLKKSYQKKYLSFTIGAAIYRLAAGLKEGSVGLTANGQRGAGAERQANSVSASSIEKFYRLWKVLPTEVTARVEQLQKVDTSYPLGSYFLALFNGHYVCELTLAEKDRVKREDILDCINIISNILNDFVRAYPELEDEQYDPQLELAINVVQLDVNAEPLQQVAEEINFIGLHERLCNAIKIREQAELNNDALFLKCQSIISTIKKYNPIQAPKRQFLACLAGEIGTIEKTADFLQGLSDSQKSRIFILLKDKFIEKASNDEINFSRLIVLFNKKHHKDIIDSCVESVGRWNLDRDFVFYLLNIMALEDRFFFIEKLSEENFNKFIHDSSNRESLYTGTGLVNILQLFLPGDRVNILQKIGLRVIEFLNAIDDVKIIKNSLPASDRPIFFAGNILRISLIISGISHSNDKLDALCEVLKDCAPADQFRLITLNDDVCNDLEGFAKILQAVSHEGWTQLITDLRFKISGCLSLPNNLIKLLKNLPQDKWRFLEDALLANKINIFTDADSLVRLLYDCANTAYPYVYPPLAEPDFLSDMLISFRRSLKLLNLPIKRLSCMAFLYHSMSLERRPVFSALLAELIQAKAGYVAVVQYFIRYIYDKECYVGHGVRGYFLQEEKNLCCHIKSRSDVMEIFDYLCLKKWRYLIEVLGNQFPTIISNPPCFDEKDSQFFNSWGLSETREIFLKLIATHNAELARQFFIIFFKEGQQSDADEQRLQVLALKKLENTMVDSDFSQISGGYAMFKFPEYNAMMDVLRFEKILNAINSKAIYEMAYEIGSFTQDLYLKIDGLTKSKLIALHHRTNFFIMHHLFLHKKQDMAYQQEKKVFFLILTAVNDKSEGQNYRCLIADIMNANPGPKNQFALFISMGKHPLREHMEGLLDIREKVLARIIPEYISYIRTAYATKDTLEPKERAWVEEVHACLAPVATLVVEDNPGLVLS